MQKIQESKFWALFWNYKGQSSDIDSIVRSQVIASLAEPYTQLRPDAAYFLLVNFDHMVGRVLSDPFMPTEEYRAPEAHYPVGLIEQALGIILDRLHDAPHQDTDGYSAHEVMRSIDGVWGQLVPMLAWA